MTDQLRTKRRYAHELYPHNENPGQPRPLSVEVPYLYAHVLGFELINTSWFKAKPEIAAARTQRLVDTSRIAFMADAMLQGLTGQEAWDWAEQRATEESGELVYERAVHYGVDPLAIKPYPCGPEPDSHPHQIGPHTVTFVQGKESECPDCTEPAEEPTND